MIPAHLYDGDIYGNYQGSDEFFHFNSFFLNLLNVEIKLTIKGLKMGSFNSSLQGNWLPSGRFGGDNFIII